MSAPAVALVDFAPAPPATYAEACAGCGAPGAVHPDEHLCPACVAEVSAYLDERFAVVLDGDGAPR